MGFILVGGNFYEINFVGTVCSKLRDKRHVTILKGYVFLLEDFYLLVEIK